MKLTEGFWKRFRWVYLQVKSLEKCISDDAVHSWTRNLPRDLTEAYNQLWESIQERDESDVALAERAIKWVLCSYRPFRSEELLEAIRYPIEGSTVGEKGQQSQQEILSLCQDFLTIDEKRGVWMLPHASVAEYFEAKGWTGWECNAFAAKTCLGFLEKSLFPPVSQFAHYVHSLWPFHVSHYDKWLGVNKEEEADLNLVAALKRFLGSLSESSDSYRKWAQNYSGVNPSNMALFAMCKFGFYHTLRDWWLEGKITEEMALQKNETGENSLALAAESGCVPICRHLTGLMDATHPDAEGHVKALVPAVLAGDWDILKLLVLEANADVNVPDSRKMTAAQCAAAYRPEMLQWMLDHCHVDLERENGIGSVYGNALIAAVDGGHAESVRIVLAAGANINAAVQSGYYGSALVAVAARCEREHHVEIAKLLLDSGADPNLPLMCGRYGSALEASAQDFTISWDDKEREECRVRLRRMLLEAGADPTAVFDRGEHGNAMAAAAFKGDKDFLKAMIDHVGVEKALSTLRQSRHPDEERFLFPDEVQCRNDTAAYLTNEVGASKDDLDGIGL